MYYFYCLMVNIESLRKLGREMAGDSKVSVLTSDRLVQQSLAQNRAVKGRSHVPFLQPISWSRTGMGWMGC